MLPILLAAFSWIPVPAPTHASLRGLAVPSHDAIWASGTEGTWLLSTDGGTHWKTGQVPGAASLDFRDIEAHDGRRAILLASGAGAASRIYQTSDAGAHWTLLFSNPDPQGFFDALSFWDEKHGILLGDPVGNRFAIFLTQDGGRTWKREAGPIALPGEGAFAASGTCLTVLGRRDTWFGTGGPRPRIFHSSDRGRSWTASAAPLGDGSAASGVFSLFFEKRSQGFAAGGNYTRKNEPAGVLAVTVDGAKWASLNGLTGYRSAITVTVFRPLKVRLVISVGTNGSDISLDDGRSWQAVPIENLNAVAASPDGVVWAVGSHGLMARLRIAGQ